MSQNTFKKKILKKFQVINISKLIQLSVPNLMLKINMTVYFRHETKFTFQIQIQKQKLTLKIKKKKQRFCPG